MKVINCSCNVRSHILVKNSLPGQRNIEPHLQVRCHVLVCQTRGPRTCRRVAKQPGGPANVNTFKYCAFMVLTVSAGHVTAKKKQTVTNLALLWCQESEYGSFIFVTER